ncbi:hypothetical protein V6N12_005863 [Hibiscus sabdariffa]|uniref:Uncharacterized protein n=1 Tax=Hibiscus sabdariffa TaxID=183260 RepID=A0ABR2EWW0_9ROSI
MRAIFECPPYGGGASDWDSPTAQPHLWSYTIGWRWETNRRFSTKSAYATLSREESQGDLIGETVFITPPPDVKSLLQVDTLEMN